MDRRPPNIALTMGDPSGIGPELAVRAAADEGLRAAANLVVYGCPDIIREAARRFSAGVEPETVATGGMKFSEVPCGRLDAKCGLQAHEAVRKATEDVLSGRMDAIVTCPVNKAAVNAAGIQFTGHTEMIAEICGTPSYAMMQSSGPLRVVFATTHIPLKDVPARLTEARIVEVGLLLRDAIVSEGIDSPKIAVAALNPHAGENGHMGMEDELVVKPAIQRLKDMGVDVEGPFPPDTLFIQKVRERFHGIISMYHDQGHIPFKMLAFDSGVNSTLGLPIIRTSVDHGTAFEIAWKGVADAGSLFAAIRLAAKRALSKRGAA